MGVGQRSAGRPEDLPNDQLLELWTRLGDLYIDHLNNAELAIDLYRHLGFEIRRELMVLWRRPE